jgi:NhaP-type Na+/H+ or K+/H+ antiporter
MSESVLPAIASIVILGAAAQWISWRLRIPSILLLLAFGFVAGPLTGVLDPDALLDDLLLPVVGLSVALILYEGGLTLRLAELPRVGGVVRNLVTVGALTTWLVAGAAASWAFGLSVSLSALLGAVLVVTGPTVIGPMLQLIRPGGDVGSILKWEGIVIDPIGALLAVLVFEGILIGEAREATAHIGLAIGQTVLIGGGLGFVAARGLSELIYRSWIPDFLQNAVSLMLVVLLYAGANGIQEESGLFAVTVMGIALANQKRADVRDIVEFKENLRVLLISAIFILLAARLRPSDLSGLWLRGGLFVAALVLVARPLAVAIATWRSKLSMRERLFLAWMAPRGIVAAAVASVFAIRLEKAGVAGADTLVPVTFTVIIGTVALYGLTAPAAARRLGVADPDPQGLLIVGAHAWARAIASMVRSKGFAVLLIDSNYANVAAARMENLRAYHGSSLGEHLLDDIDLGGIGRLLALTQNDWVNALSAQRLTRTLGRRECYQLTPWSESEGKRSLHQHLQGRWLFGQDVTYRSLTRRTAAGSIVKATPLSDSFDYAAFRAMYGENAICLFRITEEDKLQVISADADFEPQPGETLISLVDEPETGRPTAAR